MSNISPITVISPSAQTTSINMQYAAVSQPAISAQAGVVSESMTVRRSATTTPSEAVPETIFRETATQTQPIIATQTARDVQTVLASQTIMSMPVSGSISQPFRQPSIQAEAIDAVSAVSATGNMFESTGQSSSEENNTAAGESKTFLTVENKNRYGTEKFIDISL